MKWVVLVAVMLSSLVGCAYVTITGNNNYVELEQAFKDVETTNNPRPRDVVEMVDLWENRE